MLKVESSWYKPMITAQLTQMWQKTERIVWKVWVACMKAWSIKWWRIQWRKATSTQQLWDSILLLLQRQVKSLKTINFLKTSDRSRTWQRPSSARSGKPRRWFSLSSTLYRLECHLTWGTHLRRARSRDRWEADRIQNRLRLPFKTKRKLIKTTPCTGWRPVLQP